MIIGDFNNIKSNKEKWRERIRQDWSFKDFGEFISDNHLIDIGYIGLPWTSCNNWNSIGEIKGRFNRAMSTVAWLQNFQTPTCTHIQLEASDYSLLLLDILP